MPIGTSVAFAASEGKRLRGGWPNTPSTDTAQEFQQEIQESWNQTFPEPTDRAAVSRQDDPPKVDATAARCWADSCGAICDHTTGMAATVGSQVPAHNYFVKYRATESSCSAKNLASSVPRSLSDAIASLSCFLPAPLVLSEAKVAMPM